MQFKGERQLPSYTVKHHRDAAKERDWLFATYGESLREGYNNWMKELQDNAGAKQLADWTVDLEVAFDDLQKQRLPDWARSFKRFQQAGFREKLRALLSVVKNRRPPWQLKAASRPIPGLDGVILISVGIVFDINDIERIIAVRQVLHHAV